MSELKYYNTAITNSRTTIRTRTSDLDKTFSGGQCLMVREFDESVVATGSWTELWLGFRWNIRMDIPMSYSYAGAAAPSSYVWSNGNERFIFGLCDTSGFVYGELSQSQKLLPSSGGETGIPATHNSHSLCIRTLFESDFWTLNRYSGSSPARYDSSLTYSYAQKSIQPIVNVTGSVLTFPNSSQVLNIPIANFPDSNNRTLFIVRFATSSGDPKTWQIHSASETLH